MFDVLFVFHKVKGQITDIWVWIRFLYSASICGLNPLYRPYYHFIYYRLINFLVNFLTCLFIFPSYFVLKTFQWPQLYSFFLSQCCLCESCLEWTTTSVRNAKARSYKTPAPRCSVSSASKKKTDTSDTMAVEQYGRLKLILRLLFKPIISSKTPDFWLRDSVETQSRDNDGQ